MATVKKGMLTAAGEWWKHLRWTKRPFWKAERQAVRHDLLSPDWDYGTRADAELHAWEDDNVYWPARDEW